MNTNFLTHPSLSREAITQAANQFQASLNPSVLWRMNGRFERGVSLAGAGAVTSYSDPDQPDNGRLFKVRSSNLTRPPFDYLVDLEAETCECPDHWKGYFCKHRVAANIIELVLKDTGKAPISETQPIHREPPVLAKPQTVLHESPAIAEPQPVLPKIEPQPAPIAVAPIQDKDASNVDASILVASNGTKPESIMWAALKIEDKILGVEILNIDKDEAFVRALPKIIEGKKLQPQFPFQDGRSSMGTVDAKSLFHLRVFRHT